MAYKDDLCENSASVKPRPTRHRAQDYPLGVSGLETEEDKEIRRLYEESVFGPRPLSASLTKVGCPEITPLGDSTVDSLRSVEKKRFIPPPAHFSTSDMGAALTSSSDERENYSQHVWFDNQSQKSVTPQHRKKIPPPIAPKPKLPPGRLNGYPETSGARPKTQVIPPAPRVKPRQFQSRRDQYAPSTCASYTADCGLILALPHATKVRKCDFCHREYVAIIGGVSIEEERPGSPSRVCNSCKYKPPERLPGCAVQTREGWFERRYDGPQSPQERPATAMYSAKTEVKFFEPNLAKIPPVYDSNRVALMKLDTRMRKVNRKTAD